MAYLRMKRRHYKHSPLFRDRKNQPAWPTLRGLYITEVNINDLSRLASLHFTSGWYNTNLNPPGRSPKERVVQYEAKRRVVPLASREPETLYANVWVTNYYAGCVFNGAWQFPHVLQFDPISLEANMFWLYAQVVGKLTNYKEANLDSEVAEFLGKGRIIYRQPNEVVSSDSVRSKLFTVYDYPVESWT